MSAWYKRHFTQIVVADLALGYLLRFFLASRRLDIITIIQCVCAVHAAHARVTVRKCCAGAQIVVNLSSVFKASLQLIYLALSDN
jgi:hypothetical protein